MQLIYRRSDKMAKHCSSPKAALPKLKSTVRYLLVRLKPSAMTAARGPYPALADVCPPCGRRVPRALTLLVRELEAHVRTDGIYKRCGDANEVETILRNLDSVDLSSIDGITLAECVKTFLWQLKEPLIPSADLHSFTGALSATDREGALRGCIEILPEAERDTIEFMMGHWREVLAASLHNGLTVSSLATVLAPFIAGFSNERVSIDVTEALLRIDWH